MIAVVNITAGDFDLSRATPAGHLLQDESLRTTVLLLLLTEGRALDEDVHSGAPKGGWWGNSYPDVPNWELGSRLHVLTRSKATAENARLIEQEIRARLACLVEDGIALAIDVDLSWAGDRWVALVGVTQDRGSVQWIPVWEATI